MPVVMGYFDPASNEDDLNIFKKVRGKLRMF